MSTHEQQAMMSTGFAALPDEKTLAETVTGLRARGFSVEVVDDLDAARRTVLARIPEGALVMTNPSATLEATGIAQAIDHGGRYESGRSRLMALDRATQLEEIKTIIGSPEFALGSVHAITRDGVLVIASALGSQLTASAWGAAKVIFVVGAQKLVSDLVAARDRIYDHCLALEDARARQVYGTGSRVGKILEIYEEDPGRIHVVLIRQRVGF